MIGKDDIKHQAMLEPQLAKEPDWDAQRHSAEEFAEMQRVDSDVCRKGGKHAWNYIGVYKCSKCGRQR